MLVLSRKKNESIVINNDITVTVVEIRGDKVRLGIVAPKEVPVHRQEVYEAIQRENLRSARLKLLPPCLFFIVFMVCLNCGTALGFPP
jgi:carbon storage regulator